MFQQICFLICGLFVGALNSVAGGAAFILFPVLMGVGLTPVIANTTMSLIVAPGTVSAAFGYRQDLAKLKKVYFLLLIPSAAGALLGATILVRSPGTNFMKIVPYFMAVASLLLILQPQLNKIMYKKKILTRHHLIAVLGVAVAFFILAAYGGYFGAGFGIIALGILGITPIKNIQQISGLKNLVAFSVLIVGCIYFILNHLIDWKILPLFLIGDFFGGYFAAVYGRKLPAAQLRFAMILISAGVTIYTFYKFYS